jgi:hypothetical protein
LLLNCLLISLFSFHFMFFFQAIRWGESGFHMYVSYVTLLHLSISLPWTLLLLF